MDPSICDGSQGFDPSPSAKQGIYGISTLDMLYLIAGQSHSSGRIRPMPKLDEEHAIQKARNPKRVIFQSVFEGKRPKFL
jgi:hypothetical protein